MRVAYFNTGSGTGGLMIGASVFTALIRAGLAPELTVVTDCEFSDRFTEYFNKKFKIEKIKTEPEKLFRDDLDTELFKALRKIRPELIIVCMVWLPIMPLLEEFSCPKVLLIHECPDKWLSIRIGSHDSIEINIDDYDAAFSIEPGFRPPGFESLPPLVLKNREELPSIEGIRAALGINPDKKCCLVAQNGRPGEFKQILAGNLTRREERISDYQFIQTSNRKEPDSLSLFPLMDYLPAADFVIGGAGYNLFYECRYLDISGHFFSFERNAENLQWRIDTNSNFLFDVNGADVLVEKILQLI